MTQRLSVALLVAAALGAALSAASLRAASPSASQAQAAPAPQTPPDQPPVTFRVEVNYVEVDAFVTDADGKPISDLTANEIGRAHV